MGDVTLWALESNGKMVPLDVEALRREIGVTTKPQPAWDVLGGLLARLDGCPDPQVQGALAWVDDELERVTTETRPAPTETEPTKPEHDAKRYPSMLLASFGVCSIVGAGTVINWLWRLVARVF